MEKVDNMMNDALFQRFQEYKITLRLVQCQLALTQDKWFGSLETLYSKEGMSPNLAKVETIKAWPRPSEKSEVKSFTVDSPALPSIHKTQSIKRPMYVCRSYLADETINHQEQTI